MSRPLIPKSDPTPQPQKIFSLRTLSKIFIFCMLTSFTYVMNIKEQRWHWYLTSYGHLLVNLYFLLASICAVFNLSKHGMMCKLKDTIHHVACAFQFNIFIFYWIVLSYMDYQRIIGYTDKSFSYYHHFVSISRHLLDPLLVWIPVLNKKIHFKNSNIKLLLVISVIYATLNFYGVKILGMTIYPPIDWQGIKSHLFLLTSTGITIGGFYVAKVVGEQMLY